MPEKVDLYPLFQKHVGHIVDEYRGRMADGPSLEDAIALCVQAAQCAVELTREVPDLSAEDRKAACLAVLDRFYFQEIAPLDIPKVPEFVERSIVDPVLGSALHHLASGLIEGLGRIRQQ